MPYFIALIILYCGYRFLSTKDSFYLFIAALNAALLLQGCSKKDDYFAELDRRCGSVCEPHGGVQNVCSIVEPSCTCQDGVAFR